VFSCSDVNVTHEVTLTVFDVFGRSTSVAVDVVVLDSELPAVSTAPTTKVLNSGGHVSLLPSDVNTGSTDVCGVASSAVTPSSFSCDDVGVNVVALSVTDVYDNVKTAFENVTVLDETAPSLSVLPSVTRTLNAAGAGTLAASNIDDSTSDACGVAELAVNKTVLSCADVGVLPVLFTAVDVNGNNASVVVDVEVTDEVAPALSLTDLTVQLNSSGLAAINQSMVDTGSSDACGIASFVLSQTVFSCATVGDNTVTVTVTDVNGNVASDSVNVHVVDTESPVVATQDVTLTLDGITGSVELNASQIDGGSSDACGVASLTVSKSSFTCADAGANTVNLTVRDTYGNEATAPAQVTVVDTTAPVAMASPPTVYLNTSGLFELAAAHVSNGSSDACGVTGLRLNQTVHTCSDVGPAKGNMLFASDAAGNEGSVAVSYAVVDAVAPTVPLLAEYTVVLGNTTGVYVFDAESLGENATDACGVASHRALPAQVTCDMAAAGAPTTVQVRVEDVNGNVGSANTSVVVLDTTAPVLSLKTQHTFALDAAGSAAVDTAALDTGTFDACGYTLSSSVSEVSCSQLTQGVEAVVTAVDASNNTANATVTLFASDVTKPSLSVEPLTIELGSDQTATLSVADFDATYADACGVTTQRINQTSFSCADVGVQPVLFSVLDASGNRRSVVVDVTVLDSSSSPCPFPVDCVMGAWEDATECSISCGGHGTYLQNRTVVVQPENGGAACPAERNRTRTCIRPACPRSRSYDVVATYRFVEQSLDSWTDEKSQLLIDAVCNATAAHIDCSQVNVTDLQAGSVIAEVTVSDIADSTDANAVQGVVGNFEVQIPAAFGAYSVAVEQEDNNVSSGSSAFDSTWGTAGVSLFAVALLVLAVVLVVVYKRRSNTASNKSRVTVTNDNAQAAWDALKRDLSKPKGQVRDKAALLNFPDRRASQTISPKPSTQRTTTSGRSRPAFPRIKRNQVSDMSSSSEQATPVKRTTSTSEQGRHSPRTAANLQMPSLPISPNKPENPHLPGSTMTFPGSVGTAQAPSSTKTQVPTFQKPNFGSSKRTKASPKMMRGSPAVDPFSSVDGVRRASSQRASPVPVTSPEAQPLSHSQPQQQQPRQASTQPAMPNTLPRPQPRSMPQGAPPPSLGFPVPPKPPTFADPFSNDNRRGNNGNNGAGRGGGMGMMGPGTINMPPMMPGMPAPSLGGPGPRSNMPSFPARPGPSSMANVMPGRPGGNRQRSNSNNNNESSA